MTAYPRLTTTLTMICSSVFAAGCAQFGALVDGGHQDEASEQVSRVDQHSSYPAIRRINYEEVNLIEMIDPLGEAEHKYAELWSRAHANHQWGRKYDLVLAWFREKPATTPAERNAKVLQRNAVQDKILSVATSRCNVFKTYLRRQQTDVNFLLGSATTIAGVLGAVLGGANAARNLAGAAGIFSGLQAEYNQAYYSNLAAHVIVQGIDLNRNRLVSELLTRRKDLSIAEYSMEAAINDAIYIDGACSTIAGLLEAQESIKEVQNPGLTLAGQAIVRSRALQELNQSDIRSLEESGRLDALRKLLAPVASPLSASAISSTPSKDQAVLAGAGAAGSRIAAAIAQQAEDLGKQFDRVRAKITDTKKQVDITGHDVKNAFQESAKKQIFDPLAKATDKQKTVLSVCVANLEESAKRLGEGNATLLLTANDASKEIDARLGVEKAQADLRAAIAHVEHIVATATQAVVRGAATALAAFAKLDDLSKFKITNAEITTAISTDGLECK